MTTRDIYERDFDEDVATAETPACPECGGQIRTNTIETRCEDCGLVADEHQIDHGPEWRAFDEDERDTRTRTGASLTPARHDRGLSTEIGYEKRDTDSERIQRRLARMRRHHSRSRFRSKSERNLAHGLGEVRRIAGVLELAETIRDQACQLF